MQSGSSFDPADIYNCISRVRGSRGSGYQPHAFALAGSSNEYAAYSRPQPAYYEQSLMLSEDQIPRGQRRSQAPSSSSGATVPSTLFDGDCGDTSSISTAPPLYGAVHDRRPDITLAPLLRCELSQYTHCEASFESRDVQGWIDHTAAHLGYQYPKHSTCWFCDDTPSDSRSDRQSRFEDRMYHIASHIQQGQPMSTMRPDFYMLDHFYQLRLITEETYRMATGYHEAPQPRGGINPYPPASSSSSTRISHYAGSSQDMRAPQRHRKRRDGSIVYKK